MTELVLAVNRQELDNQGVGTNGIYPIELSDLNQQNYAYLPRAFADNKSENAIALGVQFPQILGYFQITCEGKILTYQRKGKEKGLLGKWSIGVGGHVSQEDFIEHTIECMEDYPNILSLIYSGAVRELKEELGLDLEQFSKRVNFTHCIVDYTNTVGMVHFGIVAVIDLNDQDMEDMKQCAEELTDVQWRTVEQLQADADQYENWSKALITGEDGYEFK